MGTEPGERHGALGPGVLAGHPASPSLQIQERLEELQSMLGWVLVRWRAQRHQRDAGSKQEERRDPESPLRASPAGQVSTQLR